MCESQEKLWHEGIILWGIYVNARADYGDGHKNVISPNPINALFWLRTEME